MNTGGPAFPHEYKYGDGTAQRCDGMTLRDYFAAKAMLGILNDPHREINYPYDAVASYAYSLADAMLKARELK
jgi:hypothetical protein